MPHADIMRGYTVADLSKLLRVSGDKIRGWIKDGTLQALNTSGSLAARPRFVILPQHLEEFVTGRQAGPTPRPAPRRRRRRTAQIDYYPSEAS